MSLSIVYRVLRWLVVRCVSWCVSSCVVGVVLAMVMHGMNQSYRCGLCGASVFCGFDAFCGAVMRLGKGQPMVLPRIVPGTEPVELGPVMLRREPL